MNTIATPVITTKEAATTESSIRLFNAETDREYKGKFRQGLEAFAKENNLKIGAFLTIPQMIKHGICFAGVKRFEGVIAIPIKTNKNEGVDVFEIEEKEDGYHAKTEKEEIKFKHQKIVLYPLELCSFYESFDVDKMLSGRHMKNVKLTNEEKALIIPNRLKFMEIHDGKIPVKTDTSTEVVKAEHVAGIEVVKAEKTVDVKDVEVVKPKKTRTTKNTSSKVKDKQEDKQEDKQPVENKDDSSIRDIELSDDLKKVIVQASQFVAEKSHFGDYLEGVVLNVINDTLHIISSNGYVLFDYDTKIECTDKTIYKIEVNKTLIKDLENMSKFSELLDKEECSVGVFPDISGVNRTPSNTSLDINSSLLAKVMKCASTFAMKRERGCNLGLCNTQMTIKPYMSLEFKGELVITLSKVVM